MYRHATAVEKSHNWGDGIWSLEADENAAKYNLDREVSALKKKLKADEAIVALSDNGHNFRKEVYAPYKGNREQIRKPLVYTPVRQHVFDSHDGRMKPGLEADDMLGILATHPDLFPSFDERIIVSDDKDLLQIPVKVYSSQKRSFIKDVYGYGLNGHTRDMLVYAQTMGGDTVDNYPGCPGIGPERAMDALAVLTGWESYDHVLRSGPRKGTAEKRWRKLEVSSLWQVVVTHFNKAGLTEDDAIQQFNIAKILQWNDFNYDTQRPKLWGLN